MKNKICGIYYIKNTSNNNIYVGQSTNIKARFYAHKSALNKSSDVMLYDKDENLLV